MKRRTTPAPRRAATRPPRAELSGSDALLVAALTAVRDGKFSARLPVDGKRIPRAVAAAFNDMAEMNSTVAGELKRLHGAVAKLDRLEHQMSLGAASGDWARAVENVNGMLSDLARPTHEVSRVLSAVGDGDLTQRIALDVDGRPLKGDWLRMARSMNRSVERADGLMAEVLGVTRGIGLEGQLDGRVNVRGSGGAWKDLGDGMNAMSASTAIRLREVTRMATAVANGDLRRPLLLEGRGEIAAMADAVNRMIDRLSLVAAEVTTVAREVGVEGRLGRQAQVGLTAGAWLDVTTNVNHLAANLTSHVRAIGDVATAVTRGDLSPHLTVTASGEVASLKDAINEMIRNLRETTARNQEQDWLNSNLARIGRLLQGQRDLPTVSRMILAELASLVMAQHCALFMAEGVEEPRFVLRATFAYKERAGVATSFGLGEGLVGQAALDKQLMHLTNVPRDHVRIASGLGESAPLNVIILPILFEGDVKAVIEMASFHRFTDIQRDFLLQLSESLGIVLNTIGATARTEALLVASQRMTELLQSQQEELQQSNEELEEKATLLTDQKIEVEIKNLEVELARQALEEKAAQLALSSKFKSEFLANMSHELRTPLNSLLVLARLIADNPVGNLSAKEVEYAGTIYSSGVDLLTLINEILDLSKIESGTMDVHVELVPFQDLAQDLDTSFRQIALDKGLRFDIKLRAGLPTEFQTDPTRLRQVLRNLLSNAFKFTERGAVEVSIRPATGGWLPERSTLTEAAAVVAFDVTDTGIGIATDKQGIIFEAFQQADGTNSRKYGGTGLGLSISREIAGLLLGDLRVDSSPNKGSTFTLYLAVTLPANRNRAEARAEPGRTQAPPASSRIPTSRLARPRRAQEVSEDGCAFGSLRDDRDVIQPGDKVLLMIEDDLAFAHILLDLARAQGFKGIVAPSGEAGLYLAGRIPPSAITLDLLLPGTDGWIILDQLKHDPATRHVPVHVISALEQCDRAHRLGAFACMSKPATKDALESALQSIRSFIERDVRSLLVVESDEVQRLNLQSLIGEGDVVTVAVSTGAEALAALATEHFDCMLLALDLPDMDGFDLVAEIKSRSMLEYLPIIAYTPQALTRAQEERLRRTPETVIVREASSPERILAETVLFLHRVESNLPERSRRLLDKTKASDAALIGRTVLIVDDDVRSIFALTSLLEHHGMEVAHAESGSAAINLLATMPMLDIVLTDIMMPVMDGFEFMREVRAMPRFEKLPIIALTAKALRHDRDECLQAGASDYISKPVDVTKLLSLMRVWLHREPMRGVRSAMRPTTQALQGTVPASDESAS